MLFHGDSSTVPQFLRQSLIGLEFSHQVRLAAQQAPGTHLSLSASSRAPRPNCFTWSLGIEFQSSTSLDKPLPDRIISTAQQDVLGAGNIVELVECFPSIAQCSGIDLQNSINHMQQQNLSFQLLGGMSKEINCFLLSYIGSSRPACTTQFLSQGKRRKRLFSTGHIHLSFTVIF